VLRYLAPFPLAHSDCRLLVSCDIHSERKTYTNIIYNKSVAHIAWRCSDTGWMVAICLDAHVPRAISVLSVVSLFRSVLTGMKALCLHSSRYGVVSPDLAEGKALLESDLKEDQPVDEQLGAHVKALWADPAIQETYLHQAEFQLNESAKYFFDRIDAISAVGYVPSKEDVLHARAPTTGIVENAFEIDGNAFKMFDVGGQRNERKKWVHCFESQDITNRGGAGCVSQPLVQIRAALRTFSRLFVIYASHFTCSPQT
jgi:hypothetical protein